MNKRVCGLLADERYLMHETGAHVETPARLRTIYDMLDNEWDLIIMHPPCTALAVSGNAHYGEGKAKYAMRLEAASWTQNLWKRCKEKAQRVAFENPVSVLARLAGLPKASYVQPWQFGHPEQKKTGFHLCHLNPLVPTKDVYAEMMQLPKCERERLHYLAPSPNRAKERSRTFQGIAEAMATQWGKDG